MCRHLGYLGPPVPLRSLLFDPPHSLATQAWAPRDMRGGGTINADGFGAGWWPPGAEAPVRHRSAMPIWTDTTLPVLAGVTSSGAVLAAIRSATVGMPVVETAAAPFTDGRWLFSHNGVIRGWPSAVAALARDLPVDDLLTLDAPTDSAILWALVRGRLRSGQSAAKAVAGVVTDLVDVAPGSRLNLLLTDGRQMVATTVGHSLSVRPGRDSTLISSEPLDTSAAWQAVPDHRLVTATATEVEIIPLLST
ncbi:ergothioneine biosynthesis protein EgtC [Actinoplanes couchii]|uniref:Gamma-glutamyl-hercynylcysteine sulfoxide hydrolase n=1 Tax=Actinoplanes couchii TaxID=403638 RepID=A0ABQ3X417_9ACTN|nr:ergothioneine biosynthesis protein EgtC [Actinoplanes couchii]MDR6326404.1 glutamine amidotransferase [Actinoplanes couchii]GID53244.1 gamma-glutamyl-hercynylcysteine sulfoxide hydrolase [Actinoplanes couchii]